jgi:membrane protein implicated in regulation of membrane protease activity
METLFLACFAFGALFTAVSAVIGMAHTAVPGADAGHFGHFGHAAHGAHAPHGLHGGAHGHVAHGVEVGQASAFHLFDALAPFLNASSLLAFLTWFGAVGYLTLRFAGWALPLALLAALLAGAAGALLLGTFLRKVLAGEEVLDARDFRLEGTLARVTVSITEHGAGEVVFEKAGRRRSEAARSDDGRAIPRGTEVVILRYARGTAHVQPWNQLLQERPPPRLVGPTS